TAATGSSMESTAGAAPSSGTTVVTGAASGSVPGDASPKTSQPRAIPTSNAATTISAAPQPLRSWSGGLGRPAAGVTSGSTGAIRSVSCDSCSVYVISEDLL